jgi:demethylmenaquinone methyltransferase / 2-methoxy-6-polyprenyl-1,4-benzoquinol methylase
MNNNHTNVSLPASSPAWDDARLVDPHHQPDKAERVRQMFSAIAPSYDLNNRLHSLWRDQAWRRFAVKQAAIHPGDVAADIACGTGDLTELLARTPASKVLGIDFTHEMLDVARQKQFRLQADEQHKITYHQGDAQDLKLDPNSIDALTIAFGIRNVLEPARALAEFARVLKPGGRLVILEFDQPRFAPMRWFNDFYCARIMPRTATLISGDRSGAYKYLPKSVASFLSREQLSAAITAAGFRDLTVRPLTFGICSCYRAIRS